MLRLNTKRKARGQGQSRGNPAVVPLNAIRGPHGNSSARNVVHQPEKPGVPACPQSVLPEQSDSHRIQQSTHARKENRSEGRKEGRDVGFRKRCGSFLGTPTYRTGPLPTTATARK